jgi:DNA gyrase subunit A
MGRSAMGVKAIELDDDDQVVGFAITDPDRQHVLAVCERGYGKRTELEEFRQQRRGGKGIILIDTSERNGPVVGIALVNDQDEVMLVTNRGQTIRTRVAEIRLTGRNAQGVRVMNVDADERVVAIEPVGEPDDEALAASIEKLSAAAETGSLESGNAGADAGVNGASHTELGADDDDADEADDSTADDADAEDGDSADSAGDDDEKDEDES